MDGPDDRTSHQSVRAPWRVPWPVPWGVLIVGTAVLAEAAVLLLLGLFVVFDAEPRCGSAVDPLEISAAKVVLGLHCLLGLGPWLVAAALTRRARWVVLGVVASAPAWWGLLQVLASPEEHLSPVLCF